MGRFERSQPNELWQTDFTAPIPLPDGRKLWPLPLLDDHSRFCLSLQMATAPSGEAAWDGFRTAAQRYGRPGQLLSDHGSAFGTSPAMVSSFRVNLWALDVDPVQGRVGHPQTQGKLERFNRTLQTDCLSRHAYSSVEAWNACLEEYRQLYNQVRPHEALDQEPPASRYQASERAFEEPDREAEEGEGWLSRRVDAGGRIWLLQHHVPVGDGLAGWRVGVRSDGEGYWTIQFRGHLLRQVYLAKTAPYKPKP